MRQTWDDYNRAADRGPGALVLKITIGMSALFLVIGIIGYAFGWVGEAASVVQAEVGPKALLEKYTWLKEAHAQLDKKQADIKVYESRFRALESIYWAEVFLPNE